MAMLQQHFSSVGDMNLRWLRILIAAALIFLGLYLAFYLFPAIAYDHFDLTSVQGNIHNLFLILLIYGTGTAALFQPSIVSGVAEAKGSEAAVDAGSAAVGTAARQPRQQSDDTADSGAEEKYRRSGLSMEDAQRFQLQLMEIMQKEELYLENELTLPDLAAAAGLSTHQVSQVINGHMSMNFYSFVNDYRLKLDIVLSTLFDCMFKGEFT